jgi:2-oxoglutarate ferredoxin oxidoreductase subunit gamma
MQNETIIAGFGGQGVLFTGKVMAYAAMLEDLQVTWFPSYGPEMRGGTANCTVVISDEEIGSPQVKQPRAVIAMNLPSLDKYENTVAPDGYLVINTSMVNRKAKRKDIHVLEVPGTELAEELGNQRLANSVLLGALLSKANFLKSASVDKALEKSLHGKKQDMVDINKKAIQKGAEYINRK